MRRFLLLGCALQMFCMAPPGVAETTPPDAPDTAQLRAWIVEMKSRERGPFQHIRWFCRDGSILEPVPYACQEHGGGVQHGEWSARTRQIRDAGYPVANILADLLPADVLGADADPAFFSMLLLEKFLIAFDDGWVFRRARSYRGALQEYDEQESANRILLALLAHPQYSRQFFLLREAVRLLPHGIPVSTMTQIRGLSTQLAERDPGFARLRDKIHVAPDGEDAQRVLAYVQAAGSTPEEPADYERLAAMIDNAYTRKPLPALLSRLERRVGKAPLAGKLHGLQADLAAMPAPADQLRLAGDVLIFLREYLPELGAPAVQLQALDTSLAAGMLAFTSSRALLESLSGASRSERLAWMHWSARVLYGLGLLTRYELEQLTRSFGWLQQPSVGLSAYRQELRYLGLPASWTERRLTYHFGDAIARLRQIEPLADLYVPDRLRSTPLLFYANVLDSLLEDAARLDAVQHSLLGRPLQSGLRPLNPGIARGTLHSDTNAALPVAGDRSGIWLVPETTPELPPVAGILTLGEGNALSHVQLLARNLGIPNVVVSEGLVDSLRALHGERIMLAVSPGGRVWLERDGPQWDAFFDGTPESPRAAMLRVNLEKLDLSYRGFLPTRELRADDSGRRVGPKAAQVGELMHRFPGMVSPGLTIPFGVYRSVLDRPRIEGQPESMFDWMAARYAEMAQVEEGTRAEMLPGFLADVRDWLAGQSLAPEVRAALRRSMQETFGDEGSYGVFVRSDTNVEDLPGFTGAGLNRTVPNVVGFDAVLDAVREVWASPFSERAFAWRQGLMDRPEHVYASVLLHQSVAAEKSGVMVTADLDTGDTRFLTIVTNYGVGGGVEGQAGETLRIYLPTGQTRLVSSATARRMRVLNRTGGSSIVPAPAPDHLLQPGELAQLVELAGALPDVYPGMVDATGAPAPADIEFGFEDGRLRLFQIRPFLRNTEALQNLFLARMDRPEDATRPADTVDLAEVPPQAAQDTEGEAPDVPEQGRPE